MYGLLFHISKHFLNYRRSGSIVETLTPMASAPHYDTFENEETLGRTFAAIAEDGRTTSEQGWYQLAALGCTLGISIIGGLISGFLSSLCYKADSKFDD